MLLFLFDLLNTFPIDLNTFPIFRLILNQMDVRLVTNQPKNGKYNLISVRFNKISKRFLCVYPIGYTLRIEQSNNSVYVYVENKTNTEMKMKR